MPLELFTRNLLWKFKGRGQRDCPPRPVFLMHIPKTAGTSLNDLLAPRFPAEGCLFRVDRPTRQVEDVNRFQFVTGHVGFEFLERFRVKPIVVTVLRHPVDRAVSLYFYLRTFRPAQMREIFKQDGEDPSLDWIANQVRLCEQANRLSLHELLLEEPELAKIFFRNRQTQILAGDPLGEGRNLVARACENLHRCDVVGLTERFEESVGLLCREMGWEPFVEFPRQNVTRQRLRVSELDEVTQEALSRLLEPDLQLYEAARNLFEQRLQAVAVNHPVNPGSPCRTPLPDVANYSFDRPIFGAGWHQREKCGTTWSSWSGPGAESWLDFRPTAATNNHFRCELFHKSGPQVVESVQVRINDQLLTLRQQENNGQIILKGRVSSQAMNASRDRLRIRFTVHHRWRPCDLDATSNDDRWLGINVSRISLASKEEA